MTDQVGSRIKRSPLLWVAVVVTSLAAVARLVGHLVTDTSPWPVTIGAGATLLIILVVGAMVNAGARTKVRHVAAQRTDATVFLTLPAMSMAGTAARLGVDRRGISADASKYTVIAILADRVEFWAGKEPTPRWSVPRTRNGVSLVHTRVGAVTTDALRIAGRDTEETEIVVRPVPIPIWSDVSGKRRQAAMEQFVRALGAEPAYILRDPS